MGKFANADPIVGTRVEPTVEVEGDSGFAAMGKPVPLYRRSAAVRHCKAMGMTDMEKILACVDGMANKLERDDPHLAMEHGVRYVDAIGVYRLMAVLLCEPKPDEDARGWLSED